MTDRDGLLVRAAALVYLGEQVAKAQEATRRELMAILKPGERAVAALSDGTEVGAVTIAKPGTRASVFNDKEFLAWVEANRPDEVVRSVRPSYKDSVLYDCKVAGEPVTKDGEFVPGVRLVQGSPSYRPSYERANVGEFLDAIRANAILAIEAPNE